MLLFGAFVNPHVHVVRPAIRKVAGSPVLFENPVILQCDEATAKSLSLRHTIPRPEKKYGKAARRASELDHAAHRERSMAQGDYLEALCSLRRVGGNFFQHNRSSAAIRLCTRSSIFADFFAFSGLLLMSLLKRFSMYRYFSKASLGACASSCSKESLQGENALANFERIKF